MKNLPTLDSGLPSTNTKEEYAAIRQHLEDCRLKQIGQQVKSGKMKYMEARLNLSMEDWWDEIVRRMNSQPGDEGFNLDLKKVAQQEYNKVQLRFINNNEQQQGQGSIVVNIVNYSDLVNHKTDESVVDGEIIE